jgi:ribosomal protein S18 acetylase RimI-like enzyme
MLGSMTVRPYVQDDLESIGRVHSRSRRAAYEGLVPADALARVTPLAQVDVWRERTAVEGAEIFVAESDGEVVGFVCLLETAEGTELNAIHLAPEALGSGLGAALMEAAVEHARARGVQALHLFVLEGNERAQAFYRRAGWRLVGPAGLHDIGGAEVGHVRFELAL